MKGNSYFCPHKNTVGMDKKLRIAFYGTPEFATGILDTLHQSAHEVVAVITAPDKPAGRGRKLQQSHVKQYATAHNIPVLQPTNLKSDSFLEQLSTYQIDVQVIVAFRMLPKQVWQHAPMGTFNLHASLLPQYRGAAPINWAIINQDEKTGVTTFFIDDKIDTGAIIDQSSCKITPRETVGTLYYKLQDLGKELTLKTLNDIAAGKVSPKVQEEHPTLKPAPKLFAHNTTIDWTKSASEVDALVRGLSPYPVAKSNLFTNEATLGIKIHETIVLVEEHNFEPGRIVQKEKQLFVACGTHLVEIVKMQLPNKKAMLVKDLLNGYTFPVEARMVKRFEDL